MALLSVFVHGGKRMAHTKTKSPIALINELTVSCQESYDSWKCIYNGGGSDPFWADGVILECKNIEQACGGIGFYNSLIIQHQI